MTRRKRNPEMMALKDSAAKIFMENEANRKWQLVILGQERADEVQRLWDIGFTCLEIGNLLGVSYQQAHRIITNSVGYVPRLDCILDQEVI